MSIPGPVCPGPEFWLPAGEDDLPALPGLDHHQDRGGGQRHGLDPVRRLLPVRLLALRLHPLLCGQSPGGKSAVLSFDRIFMSMFESLGTWENYRRYFR